MKQFKLKEEYNLEGLKVTKQVLGIGNITFELSKVNSEDYYKWINLGFEELFEEIVIEQTESNSEQTVEEAKEYAKTSKKKIKMIK